jgi:prepilin signal peptidase PulO-like enzyme (type II secretory pathway)
MILLYWFSLLVLIGTLFYTSVLDLKYRKVKFENWYPLMAIGVTSTLFYIILNFKTFDLMTNVILITTVVVFWLCGHFKLYGGADAWALILITIFSITIPFSPILHNVYTGIGVSTYINSYIVYILMYPTRRIFEDTRDVPYMVYITIGFLIAIFIGDIYNYIIGVIL